MPSEHMEQVQLVAWMRRCHPEHPIFAIPNGGNRSGAIGAQLKAEGVTRGVPDLYIPTLHMWVEMKKADRSGRVSSEQHAWREILVATGHQWIVCHGFVEAQETIEFKLKNAPPPDKRVLSAVHGLREITLKRIADRIAKAKEARNGRNRKS